MTLPRLPATLLLSLLPLGFLAVMVVAPLFALARYDDAPSAWALLADDYMQWRLLWTLLQALITCVLVLLSGVPVAWALARLDFRGRRLVLRLLMLPFVMPTPAGVPSAPYRVR